MAAKRDTSGIPGDVVDRLARADLRHVALIAFVAGVLFHACVVYAVLDDGRPQAAIRQDAPATREATATATRPPDRTNCEEIRGTDYRSDAERNWFRANCT